MKTLIIISIVLFLSGCVTTQLSDKDTSDAWGRNTTWHRSAFQDGYLFPW